MKNGRVTHRVPAEGADPLVLAGVNDENLLALEKAAGVQVALRGDHVMVSGPLEAVENAVTIASSMVDIARMMQPLTPEDVARIAANGQPEADAKLDTGLKIVLPGLRRAVRPKTAGQARYLSAIRETEIVVGIGPAGTGKTYLAVAAAAEALARKQVKRLILARPAVEAGERLGFLPGDLQARSIPT